MIRVILLLLIFVSCGENMTKETLIELKVEKRVSEYRDKLRVKCEKEYWAKANNVADSLLAMSAIKQSDSLLIKGTKPRPKLDYQPFVDTFELDRLFDKNIEE